ncbi:cytochrome d ubiquinol oxidase subunit II [Weissella tructae]|uniref:Cytochrome d ubiquinol oxidase, subunit II n=2 Tax=Weissella TaxID=46255 RepID=A0A075U4X9_9LACO|nr:MULTISPECIES: cytochrome d ubiquinol oxidase subunit II [Weissella]AIG65192.1 Cytochrome d ubiquinol oxidase, subunit II [Weissella tructae]AIM62505.1 Cytochrome d ubiquinol oxidase, subunit II [Weissella ceti]ELA07594.1 cytochrome bd-type oxidase subunit II [Weissella ceti NC36]QVV91575.1 cytochrome d ubiquinol oxidase subunit II [Weissella tructae]
MTFLQILWFVLVGILFAGFFFLEGFDFGIGMSVKTVAQNEEEEDALIETIGPHWDGNEVWLITAGGAMFAAIPFWYASLFSGFYLILLIILLGLIFRGVSFEFREAMQTTKYRNLWTTVLAVSSFVVPFFFGVMFVDVVQGMPIDANGDLMAGFSDYINVFSIIGGVALSLISYMHGLNYMRLKMVPGVLTQRAAKQLSVLYPVLLAGEVAFAIGVYFKTDFFVEKPIITLMLLALIVALTLVGWWSESKSKELLAFLALGFTIITLVALLFTGLFPRVMIGNDPATSILLQNATSTQYTLVWMSWIALIMVPIVVGYQTWSFWVFRKRISVKHED